MPEKYRRIREIGRGGMSFVFLAEHIEKKTPVAIKVLKKEILHDQEYIRRFFREARIIAQLNHPHIIKIIESNFQDNEFYIITEYVENGDFRSYIFSDHLTLIQKLEIIVKITHALIHAHEKGIVHRDLKPSNILLHADFTPKLCDFGIATVLWGQESRLTRTNEVMGTIDYIAPEQKENSKNVDFRADLYSIGVIVYSLITGIKPQGAFLAPIEICPYIPKALNSITMKCLQPEPAKRYKSTINLYNDLSAVCKLLRENPFQPSDFYSGELKKNLKQILLEMKSSSIHQKIKLKKIFLEQVDKNDEKLLLEYLQDSEGLIKETIIEGLGKIKSKNSCQFLIDLLSNSYYNKSAAKALGEIECLEAENKLIDLLVMNNDFSHIAMLPLAKLNSKASAKYLIKFLKTQTHKWILMEGIHALSLMTDHKAQNYLSFISLNHQDADIRSFAKKLIRRI
jgi:serine/threonine protein kinase